MRAYSHPVKCVKRNKDDEDDEVHRVDGSEKIEVRAGWFGGDQCMGASGETKQSGGDNTVDSDADASEVREVFVHKDKKGTAVDVGDFTVVQ